jgi:regulator of nucleoside diphosphate kinase
MNHTPIYITREDNSKLRLLISTALYSSSTSTALRKLGDELDRAAIVDLSGIPTGVVTMDSRVEFEDLATGEIEDYVITFPDRADVAQKRISILAPIGTALIGCREGDLVSWATPGGLRRLRVRRVLQSSLALVP